MFFKQSLLYVAATLLLTHAAQASPLRDDLRPLVKTLTREIEVYHWVPREQLGVPSTGAIDPSDSRAMNYLTKKISEFWDASETPTGQVGNGLYTAIDPIASRNYGGPHWALIRILLGANSRFLDLRNSGSRALSAPALDYLRKNGCQATLVRQLFGEGPFSAACFPTLIKALRLMDIQAVVYSYPVSNFDGCDLQRTQAAIVITDSDQAKANAQILVNEVPTPDPSATLRLRVQDYFRRAKMPTSWFPWPDLASSQPEIDLSQWLSDHVFGCKNRYREDIDPINYLVSGDTLRTKLRAIQTRATQQSKRLGISIDPELFKDLAARRFINRPDWETYLFKQEAAGKPVDPREVYDPAPTTWDQWLNVTQTEVHPAAIAQQKALDDAALLLWNGDSIRGTVSTEVIPGQLKTTPNYGANTNRADQVDADQIYAMFDLVFPGESKSPLKWDTLVCREDLPAKIPIPGPNPDCQSIWQEAQELHAASSFWQQTLDDMTAGKLDDNSYVKKWYWYACWPRLTKAPGSHRNEFCGMILYPDPDSVPKRLDAILGEINSHFASADPDPIPFALRMQRLLVALHPFNKGNGRVSRWVMDYITAREGLPPILVDNMDLDLTTNQNVYEEFGRLGSVEGLGIMDRCLSVYENAQPSDLASIQKTRCGLAGQ